MFVVSVRFVEFVVSVDWLGAVMSAFAILHVPKSLWEHISKLHLMEESTGVWHNEKPN